MRRLSQQSNFEFWLQHHACLASKLLAKMFQIKYCALIIVVHFLCHVHSRIDTRIVGGEVAKRYQYPFYVKLTITELNRFILLTTKHECGGTLISENAVLTAGHCLQFERQIIVRARFGFYHANDTDGQQRSASKQNIVHEKYDPKTLENDIGLVLLAIDVRFTDTVKTIPISCEYTRPETAITIIGAGLLNSTDDELPSRLYWNTMTTITNMECARYFDDIKDTLICAKGDAFRRQNTCHGDSGGPVVRTINGATKLIALVSFGAIGDCGSGLPNGFTRVGSYSDWIAEKTKRAITCSS